MRFWTKLVCPLALVVSLPGQAMSQTITEDSVISKFLKQSLQFNAKSDGDASEIAEEDRRGLAIVSLNDEGKTSKGYETEASSSGQLPIVVRYDKASTLDVKIEFALDSAEIEQSEFPKLLTICSAIIQLAEIPLFRVIGHTDQSGTDAHNLDLSERRATEIGRYFISECGISAKRLEIIGYGERFPTNQADPFSAENRRVEFQALG